MVLGRGVDSFVTFLHLAAFLFTWLYRIFHDPIYSSFVIVPSAVRK
jgi:hypothetical protein